MSEVRLSKKVKVEQVDEEVRSKKNKKNKKRADIPSALK